MPWCGALKKQKSQGHKYRQCRQGTVAHVMGGGDKLLSHTRSQLSLLLFAVMVAVFPLHLTRKWYSTLYSLHCIFIIIYLNMTRVPANRHFACDIRTSII